MYLRFEARELPPYQEHVEVDDLSVGEIYYRVIFCDTQMLVPMLMPVVFVGTKLGDDNDVEKHLYFQDYESFDAGVRFELVDQNGEAVFFRVPVSQSTGVCVYERALDVLLRCSLRQQKNSGHGNMNIAK